MSQMKFTKTGLAGAFALVAAGSMAHALEEIVTEDITTDTVWTSDNTYNLQGQIYVKPGASLTIEAGTVVASTPTSNGSGSLAVCRGAQIFVNGTSGSPVIMTSTNDDMINWREACNEWGNLTIMGNGYIGFNEGDASDSGFAGNSTQMEGLTAAFPGDPDVVYGGTDDDDDSGSISYLNLRYGGRVVGLTNELNGLSLGALGRATDISNVEIMNNVDDGIEIWGGTVNIKNASIWNIGDDSVDLDQGYRGQMQNILIVQGYSTDDTQGSGVGDNGFEHDGAENSDAQPRTRGCIYNATFIGQPDGDGATAWRDGAGMQYRNCIFMDCGEKVVRPDNVDGDGAQGYGHNGTATFAELWNTPATTLPAVNSVKDAALRYTAQMTDGNVCEMRGSVFFNNTNYDEADARGVFDAGNNNVKEPATSPLTSIVRETPVIRGGKLMARVIGLNPTPVGAASGVLDAPAPDNGFFTAQSYSGAFSPDTKNWLCGWSAASSFGILSTDCSSNEVLVSSDITSDVTWTADNTYNLQGQIYVKPGASLTIEAGTVVASTPTSNGSGSLAVCRGAQIFVNGTSGSPVIMTSTNDDMINWREACNEWGNLTIMGNGYIGFNEGDASDSGFAGNSTQMEGLTAAFPGDPDVVYGGTDDDDDSGSISYLNLRYGGRVVGLTNELNGLSLGALGRATDISNVEIMNNVDDGIEIWGGTVNIKNASIWNIGDDSVDLDQGYRGQMQNILIVQGYSTDDTQGSGVGDNGFEHDGAENSDAQPRTRGCIYNATFIGQPDGDGATAWRDGAGMQYRNCIFMDCGEKVVRPDNVDGDGAQGYGHNGTATFAELWNTPATTLPAVNSVKDAALRYTAQMTDGNVCEMRGSVFFNNTNYDEADARGVFDAGNNNVKEPGVQPIVEIVRDTPVIRGGKVMARVSFLDPRASGDAAGLLDATAPDNGFFAQQAYSGAFGESGNWLCGWSTSSMFGMMECETTTPCPADFTGDGEVGGADLSGLLGAWGTQSSEFDLSGDGEVGGADLSILLGFWGDCE